MTVVYQHRNGQVSINKFKEILCYPKEGQGRLNVNIEDYLCLAVDQFLNDKIIDFYLKYLWDNLETEKQDKVHIFSTFFYKRLTSKPIKTARKSHPFEVDPTLTAAEKRHCRVKNWTKKINLFEKDFIVIPINENAHWFLAIICFPSMIGPQTFDGKPYNPEPKLKKSKRKTSIHYDGRVLSDIDNSDSDDVYVESDDSEDFFLASRKLITAGPSTATIKRKKKVRVPIKQPCILIFDSLRGSSRSRVIATLRDYLTEEYKSKMESERVFNRDVIKGVSVQVPQQTNHTDCGLYLLQYVEQFFKDPIKDYQIPITGIDNWFEDLTVTKKREDICNLIKELMEQEHSDTKQLPNITLPTLKGKLIEKHQNGKMNGEQETDENRLDDTFTDDFKNLTDQKQSSKCMRTLQHIHKKNEISEFHRQIDKDASNNFKSKRRRIRCKSAKLNIKKLKPINN